MITMIMLMMMLIMLMTNCRLVLLLINSIEIDHFECRKSMLLMIGGEDSELTTANNWFLFAILLRIQIIWLLRFAYVKNMMKVIVWGKISSKRFQFNWLAPISLTLCTAVGKGARVWLWLHDEWKFPPSRAVSVFPTLALLFHSTSNVQSSRSDSHQGSWWSLVLFQSGRQKHSERCTNANALCSDKFSAIESLIEWEIHHKVLMGCVRKGGREIESTNYFNTMTIKNLKLTAYLLKKEWQENEQMSEKRVEEKRLNSTLWD